MSGELAHSGVSVSCLCPGPTKTNWAAHAGKADSKAALDPLTVAQKGFAGMQRGDLIIIPAPLFAIERYGMSLLPRRMQVALIEKWQRGLILKGQ